jgi:hypothetical protein
MAGFAVTVSLRQGDGEVTEERLWAAASLDLLCSATPWRTFRWYKGQRHYSGIYWSATTHDLVLYESRLELARLLFADFDSSVRGIVAQPFLLKARAEGKARRHIPDYLLITEQGPVVVDVKPRRRLSDPVVCATFAWTRHAVESRGWRYEVWSEPPRAELENVRFLAGFRREWLFSSVLLDELRHADLDSVTIGAATQRLPQWPEPCVRAGIHHLLWRRDLHADLTEPLRSITALRRTP